MNFILQLFYRSLYKYDSKEQERTFNEYFDMFRLKRLYMSTYTYALSYRPQNRETLMIKIYNSKKNV